MAAPAARPRTPGDSSHTATRDPRRDATTDNPFRLVTPALEASVVCTSIACDHPKRRMLCGHVDCAYAHENERCLGCSVARRAS